MVTGQWDGRKEFVHPLYWVSLTNTYIKRLFGTEYLLSVYVSIVKHLTCAAFELGLRL